MTNSAAIGYMMLAARDAELDGEMIMVLEHMMRRAMDLHSEDEAEEVYRKS